jgi:hypothetical protein
MSTNGKEVTGGKPFAFTIVEFCHAYRISPAHYFAMRRKGKGPVELRLGRRRIISAESAEAWRRAREQAA